MLRNPFGVLSRSVATLLLAALLPVSTTACFGSFRLTQKLHQFNREVSQDRWTRWFIFLLMAGFPVYAAGLVIDGLFANAIEFWGGRNPFAMAPGTTEVLAGADGSLLRVTAVEAGVLDVELVEATGARHALRVVQHDASVAAYKPDGRLLGTVEDFAGEPRFVANAEGR